MLSGGCTIFWNCAIRAKLVLGVFLLFACLSARAQTPPRALSGLETYVVFYGRGQLERLADYDLAIIHADTLSKTDLARLKASGVVVIAYLSLGEVAPDQLGEAVFDPAWILEANERWGSYRVDASQESWQARVLYLAGQYLERGFDGLFLDTVDTIDIFPQTTEGMIRLIARLDESYPEALLIQNRGFGILDDVLSHIDALMVESLSSTYDFATGSYVYVDNSELALELYQFKQKTGLPILSLDYSNSPAMAKTVSQIARTYGFVPAVSEISLMSIPKYRLD